MLIPFPKYSNRLMPLRLGLSTNELLSTLIFPLIAAGHAHISLTEQQHW